MLADYTTFLVKSQLGKVSDRRAEKVMKSLDRAILAVFEPADRQLVERLLPGFTARRYGKKFGLSQLSLRRSELHPAQAWDSSLSTLQRELGLKSAAQAATIVDNYIKAHVSLMSAQSRLQLTRVAPDSLLRAYLRVIDATT